MTKVYDNATDLITFARSSSGTALRRVGYGDELVVDGSGNWVGDFDVAADLNSWADFNSSSSYASGSKAISTTYGFGPSGAYMTFPTEAGKIYQATAEVVSSTGYSTDTRLRCGNGSTPDAGLADSDAITAPGAVSVSFVATGTTSYVYLRNTNAYTTVWDNISVKEVIFDRATDDLVLFNHPDDIPRIEYGSDGSLKGLLIEEQRTNLFSHSNDFFGNWSKNSSPTITENASTGPDGTLSMSRISANGTIGSGVYKFVSNPTGVASYTFSVFIRAVSNAGNIRLRLEGSSLSDSGIMYDAHNAAFVSNQGAAPDAYTIEDFGNDIYRVSVTATTTGAGTLGCVIYDWSTAGAVFDIYGAQLEEGSFPTSYIPTSGSQSTRSADVASIPVSAFGYNQDAGTVVVEGTRLHDAGSLSYASLNDGSGINRFTLYIQSTEKVNGYAFGNGGALTLNGPTISPPTSTTWGMSYAKIPTGGRYELAVDGAIYDNSDSIYGEFSGKTQLSIGSAWGYSEFANGHIKSLSYFPRRLTDAQLQELTS